MSHEPATPSPWFGSAVANNDPHLAPANGMPAPLRPSVTIMELSPLFPLTSLLLVMKTAKRQRKRALASSLARPPIARRQGPRFLSPRVCSFAWCAILPICRFRRALCAASANSETAADLYLICRRIAFATGGVEPHYRHVPQGLSQ